MLTLKLEAAGGDTIEATASDMQRLADSLGVVVEVQFNEVLLFAVPGGCGEHLIANFHHEAARPAALMKPRWAWSNRAPAPEAPR